MGLFPCGVDKGQHLPAFCSIGPSDTSFGHIGEQIPISFAGFKLENFNCNYCTKKKNFKKILYTYIN